MTETDIEERLRRYGAHLDALAEERTASELIVGVQPNRRRAGRVLAASVAVAAVIAGVVVVKVDDDRAVQTRTTDQPTPEPTPATSGEQTDLPRLVIDGWEITGFHSDSDLAGSTGRQGFVQSFRDPALGFDGPGLVVTTQPTTENWGTGQGATELTVQGQPAWLMRFSPLAALMTWHPGDGRLVALYGDRLTDAQLTEIAEDLRPKDGGWQLSGSELGLSELNAGPPAPLRAMAETSFTRGGRSVQLRQQATSIIEFETLVQDRIMSSVSLREASVGGEPAALVRYLGDAERWAAMWYADGVLHELDGNASEETFLDALASIRRVDEPEWIAVLPGSIVTADERDAVVTEMLRDVPIPPDFDDTRFRRSNEPIERYQLGAAVTGAIVCAWVDRGDDAARAAMRDVREWPVLQQMVDQGDYAEALWESTDGWLAGSTGAGQIRMHLGCE
jgi:hypothetical protein